jgi:regulator of replication initiation timing
MNFNTRRMSVKIEAVEALFGNLNIDVDNFGDENIKQAILLLYNLIEELSQTIRALQEENQRLRDEVSRLKGEQPKPRIRPNKQEDKKDISSDGDRKGDDKPAKRVRESKIEKIEVNRTEICKVDPQTLPEDAKFKGHESVIVQDLKIETDNIEFKKEVYYSPSQRKTYRGQLPLGYEGEFGPTVKALTIILKHVCNTSEPKILEFFRNCKIYISGASISRILTKDKEVFHQEKEELYRAGLESTRYQQIDDTGARVNGKNYHTHIVCNELYTAYFTTEHKDRLTIIDILRSFKERRFCFNDETISLLEQLKVPKKTIGVISKITSDYEYTESEVNVLIAEYLPEISELQKTRILEASAIASYHREVGYPVVEVLMCDDAPQFKLVSKNLALCWVHDGRHYKKLEPVIPDNVRKVKEFIGKYWAYYRRLLGFKKEPSKKLACKLAEDFDKLFSTHTGYDQLDERIAKTKDKKEELLMVLKYPEIPLHNNESELGARAKARERDVSLQNKTDEGTKAADTIRTIVQTAKKLSVNAYEYIFDRVSKRFKLPSLAEIIRRKSHRCQVEFCDSG